MELLDICRWSYVNDVSDIHIEPLEKGIDIRVRQNGRLNLLKSIDKSSKEVFLENAKSVLGFNMSISGLPQDSRYSHHNLPVDFRCNLMPVLFGEKICIRLLVRNQSFSLKNYKLEDSPKTHLLNTIKKNQGLIVISGPTGSGKSTLLYSILGSIDKSVKNVNTIEDPVEYTIPGLNQIPVRVEQYKFSDALKALMRQDPDVIMVGEIRDSETAEAALHAASTGHLVLTTVHANNSNDIFNRLVGLGVARELLDSTILFASAQRLLKLNCQSCLIEDPNRQLFTSLSFEKDTRFTPKTSRGCKNCNNTGVSGRALVFEFVAPKTENGQKTIVKHGDLESQAYELLRKGEINADEAYSCFSH